MTAYSSRKGKNMAERAEQSHDQHDAVSAEPSPALSSLVLIERRSRAAPGEQWTAQAADGRLVDVWCLGPMDPALRRYRADTACELIGIRHPNLVPVLAAGERDGHLWVVSEPDAGCSLRRLLAAVTLTPEQAGVIVVGVLRGLEALHQADLTHGWLDARSGHVGETGQIRLGEWSLGLDWPDASAPWRGDHQAAVRLLGRLGGSIRWSSQRVDDAATLRRALGACLGGPADADEK